MSVRADSASKLRGLVEAGIALSSELSLDALLQQIIGTAAELTEARYAALGVIDSAGRELERFVTTGIDPETHAAIGTLPRGRGILGVLIRDAAPLRLHDIADDSRSVGFPPNHPPMRTFLGVPILLRGVAYGNLYLTEKAGGGDFTQDDEDLTKLLAAQAAVAIENSRLYASATRWLRQLESLNEIGNAIASEVELSRLLELVARRLRELVDARLVMIALPAGPRLRVEVAHGDAGEHAELTGTFLELGEAKWARVFDRRQSERVDSVLDDPEIDQAAARRLGALAALYVPLVVQDEAIGVIVATDRLGAGPRFTDDDLRLAELFAERAAIAVNLSERVTRDALRRVVEAQELERTRLARELHDETGQALTSILLGLKALEEAPEGEARHEAGASLRELVSATLQEVRRLAVELRPSALDDFGLVAAVRRLAETFAARAGVHVDVEARVERQRLPRDAETALYRIVQEALTNVAKHAGATAATVRISAAEHSLAVDISDDGAGGADMRGGTGLSGLADRVAALDGELTVTSAPGAGTTVHVELPLAG